MHFSIKLRQLFLLLFTPVLLLVSCGQNKTKEPETKEPETKVVSKEPNREEIAAKIDTGIYHIDTIIYPVKLDMEKFALLITKDKYDENKESTLDEDEGGYISPLSVHVFDYTQNKIIKTDNFSENEFYEFNPRVPDEQSKKSFLSLINSAGGSGFLGAVYQLNSSGSFQFKKVVDFGELSYLVFSKDGDRIIKLEGEWNFDEEETHFSEHRYKIFEYSLADPLKINLLGKTKQKYPGADEEITAKELFNSIKSKEPGLLKSVDPSDFVFRE